MLFDVNVDGETPHFTANNLFYLESFFFNGKVGHGVLNKSVSVLSYSQINSSKNIEFMTIAQWLYHANLNKNVFILLQLE